MKTPPPPLLPLLRSPLQAEILTRLLLSPDHAFSLTELAGLSGASIATVQREVTRAEEAGVVSSQRIGPTRLVRADTAGTLYRPLADLLLVAFGPAVVLAEELAGVRGIEEAYIFGSWAARYRGERGHAPHDVDVIVIGVPDRDAAFDAAERAERRLGRPVQLTVRSPEAWHGQHEDPFVQQLKSRPLVPIGTGGPG